MNPITELSTVGIIMLGVLILSSISQALYYLIVFRKAAFNKSENKDFLNNNPVSVIIAAKNEAKNLKMYLPKILNQNYPNFEVIVVNDASKDDTEKYLKAFSEKYNNLRIISLKQSQGKKHAISVAIKESKHELLLFIDADCYPVSHNWISHMTSPLAEDKHIVLGYGAYKKGKSLLSKFIAYDTFMIMMQYFGAAKIGKAYMGVGRNLAYKKQIWLDNNGFESHKDLITGDDDLFIREVATKNNTAISDNYDSITISEPEKTFNAFFKQKSRHLSGVKKYNLSNKLLSGGELLSRALFYISLIITLIITGLIPALIAFSTVWIIKIIVINKLALKFKDKSVLFHTFIFDIFAFLVYLFLWFNPKKNYFDN